MASSKLNIDWKQDEKSLRKQLLKLNKAKLIKLCKNNKVSNTAMNGSKQQMVDALIKKKNKKKKLKQSKSKSKPKAIAKQKIAPPKLQEIVRNKSSEIQNKPLKETENELKSENETIFVPSKINKTETETKADPIEDESEDDYDLLDEDLVSGFIHDLERKTGNLSYSVPLEVMNLIQNYIDIDNVVICNGSGFIKSGFAGDEAPKIILPSLVHNKRSIEYGIVKDWNDVEKLWENTFRKLNVNPNGADILLSEPPLNPKANREKITTIMFESFNVHGMYVAIDAVLSLYASGRTTGLVLDSGFAVSHSVGIYEGYAMSQQINRADIGGKDVTNYLQKILAERGYLITSETARDVKEKFCYIALESERENGVEESYKLPDNRVITIGNERFRAPEIMFKPMLIGNETFGLHKLIEHSIAYCDVDVRRDMYTNVLLSGGNTLFQGFQERMKKELSIRPYVRNVNVNVIAPKERNISAWIGGSILSSLSTFEEMWITREEYEESGVGIVHRKCF